MGNPEKKNKTQQTKIAPFRWQLLFYDIGVIIIAYLFVFGILRGQQGLSLDCMLFNFTTFVICIFTSRFLGRVYSQILRYGGIQVYMRLMFFDGIGFVAYFIISRLAPFANIPLMRMVAFVSLSLLGSLLIRMVYRYAFKTGTTKTAKGRFLLWLLRVFAGMKSDNKDDKKKINVAILGAGNIGVSLVQELMTNKDAIYNPVCFIDVSKEKTGRQIFNLQVFDEDDENLTQIFKDLDIQEVIFTASLDNQKRQELYKAYKSAGCKVRVYDSPQMSHTNLGTKVRFRDFSVEELLFRRQQFVVDDRTMEYYKGKTILITGGGGSIGSEICRQLAKMNPNKLVILDIYENGAYDVQQELKIKYGKELNIQIEICSITDKSSGSRPRRRRTGSSRLRRGRGRR